MGRKPFINKKDARHFQIVHRSMRDPKFYDQDASEYVLKPITDSSSKLKHGSGPNGPDTSSFSDHEDDFGAEEHEITESTAGTAALYGIYYDDREYDYLQHLKPMGAQGGSVFVSAKPDDKPTSKSKSVQFYHDLPEEAQASLTELELDPVSRASADGNVGLGLHLSDDIREVLYALDDDAYVDDEDDRYFDNLAKDELDDECLHLVTIAEQAKREVDAIPEILDWTMAARIKDIQSQTHSESDESELDSVSELPQVTKSRKSKRKSLWDADSMTSMTSSILSRTSHQELLDDRFDQMIAREYDDEDMGAGDAEDPEDFSPEQAKYVDFLLQDFLDKVHVTTQNTPQENLRSQGGGLGQYDKMRQMLKTDENGDPLPGINLAKYAYESVKPVDDSTMPKPMIIEDKYRDRWDCESVLSTYSNVENRPRVISDRGQRRRRSNGQDTPPSTIQSMLVIPDVDPSQQIKLSARTGMPKKSVPGHGLPAVQESDEEEEDEELVDVVNEGAARPKYEDSDDKRARKRAIREARRERRIAKQDLKQAFKLEATKQARDSVVRKNQAKSVMI